jgi:hypothetical protein
MSFLSTPFLFALPLIAVPVAIHLLSRRRQEIIRWGAMQFLLDSSIRRRKFWRVDDLVLMLLRTAAVLALILALAQPLVQRTGWGGPGRDVVFVWDVSLSMDRRIDGEPVFARLIRRTEELFSQLSERDRVRGLVTIGKGEWIGREPVPADRAHLMALLETLKGMGVAGASADWPACLGGALRADSPASAASKQIVVLSDHQAEGWKAHDQSTWSNLAKLAESAEVPTAVELHNVVDAAPVVRNLAVSRLTVPRALLGPGERCAVKAEVRNHGRARIESRSLTFTADGQSLGTISAGPWEPGQSTQVAMEFVPAHGGTTLIACRIDDDDELPLDNRSSLVIEVVDQVSLLIVDDATAGDLLQTDQGYVLAALGQSEPLSPRTAEKGKSVFRGDVIPFRELAAHRIHDYRAILLLDPPPIENEALNRLAEFVRSGGGLWWCLGGRTEVDAFNDRATRQNGGLAPWRLRDVLGDAKQHDQSETIHPPGPEHPATALLGDTQRLDLDRSRIYRRFRFQPAADEQDVSVLLQTGRGEPLAIETALGRGRIIVQAIPLGVGWTNLPLLQAYVPWVHEWLWHLVQPTGVSRNLQPGEPLRAILPGNEHVTAVELIPPAGAVVPLLPRLAGAQRFCQTRQTQLPGEYQVQMTREGAEPIKTAYHVAGNPLESNLAPLSDEAVAMLAALPAVRVNPADPLAPPATPATPAARRRGAPLSGWLIAIVLLSGLAELWLARRMAARRFSPAAGFDASPSVPAAKPRFAR